MEVEQTRKTDETTAAQHRRLRRKKKKIRQEVLLFSGQRGYGLIGIGTFTLLSKLNPFVQARDCFRPLAVFPRCFRWF
ncbi:MAG: hypothetical protein ACLU1U_00415 [Lachnospiraceae bacterium]